MSSPGDEPLSGEGAKHENITPLTEPDTSAEKATGELTSSKKRKRELLGSTSEGPEKEEKDEEARAEGTEIDDAIVPGPEKRAKVEGELDDAKGEASTDQGATDAQTPLQLGDFIEPLNELRTCLLNGSTAIGSLLSLLPTKGSVPVVASAAGQQQQLCWGKLIALKPKQSTGVSMTGPAFTIGGNNRCDLTLVDPGLGGSTLCKIHHTQSGLVFIETLSSRSIVLVNGRAIKKGSRSPIKNGDNIKLVAKQIFSFRFQKLGADVPAPAWPPTSAGVIPLPSPFGEPGSKDTAEISISPFSGMSALSMLRSRRRPGSSSLDEASLNASSASPAAGNATNAAGANASPVVAGASNASSASSGNSLARRFLLKRSVSGGDLLGNSGPPPLLHSSSIPHPSSLKITSRSVVLPLLYDLPAAPSSPPSTGSNTNSSNTGLSVRRKELYKDDFAKKVIRPDAITTTFEAMPYHISKEVKENLINAAFIYLKKPEFAKFTVDLPTVSRRILLAGPPGTEAYQEQLVRALAKHLQASLLIFDGSKPDVLNELVTRELADLDKASGEQKKEEGESEKGKEKVGDTEKVETEGKGKEKENEKEKEKESDLLKEKDLEIEKEKPDGELDFAGVMKVAFRGLGAETMDIDLDAEVDEPDHPEDDAEDDAEDDDEDDDDVDSDETWTTPVFKKGDRVKFVGPSHHHPSPLSAYLSRRGGPHIGDKGVVIQTRNDGYQRKIGVRFERVPAGAVSIPGEDTRGYFVEASQLRHETEPAEPVERSYMEALFEVLSAESNVPCILYIKDAEKNLLVTYERYNYFKKQLESLTGPAIVIGSSIVTSKSKDKNAPGGFLVSKSGSGQATLLDFALFDHISRLEERARETSKSSRVLGKLFPTKILIKAPTESKALGEWTKRIAKDQRRMKFQQNKTAIQKILERNGILCEDKLHSRLLKQQVFSQDKIERIVGWAVSYQVIANENSGIGSMKDEKLVITSKAIEYGIEMMDSVQPQTTRPGLKDVVTENDFERKLLAEAIPPNELNVQFDDIGALDKVKSVLMELVMLPLQRPELFRKGNLRKPCKGILLFGPPGTGKTMLAKAVATESGANFLNCSMSAIGSKWFGEGEKYARAIFTLASKIAPCVIFIDEVDSILGSREKAGEHEAMRKIKNEFMSMWDGLKTKDNERVIVLAATNRPFDLDDAVLRRMPRRLLVDLPDVANREKILRVILANEDLEKDFNFSALAEMTEGFSGSDLKNLCISAAYRPIREIIAKEKEDKKKTEEGEQTKLAGEGGEPNITKTDSMETEEKKEDKGKEKVTEETEKEKEKETEHDGYYSSDDEGGAGDDASQPYIRPLKLEDFVGAKKEHSASVHEDAHSISELRRWNEMYGEGGSMRGKGLSYFL